MAINTALPPLADDTSNPSLFNVAKNARALGYRTDVDEEILQPVSRHFTAIAKREGFTIGAAPSLLRGWDRDRMSEEACSLGLRIVTPGGRSCL